MQKIKTVLRLASLGLCQRQIAVSCQIGQSTVSDSRQMFPFVSKCLQSENRVHA